MIIKLVDIDNYPISIISLMKKETHSTCLSDLKDMMNNRECTAYGTFSLQVVSSVKLVEGFWWIACFKVCDYVGLYD